jgi:hypothetical protein
MHQSTGKNISFPRNIRSQSVDEPFYQTLCLTLEVVCIRADCSCKQLCFFALPDLYDDLKTTLTSTGNIEGKVLPKYFYFVTIYCVNLTFSSIFNSGTSSKPK